MYLQTSEVKPIESAIQIFASLNWGEREIWDLFGIFFTGHVDIRRILLDYGFKGHPMRKDFPLTGYVEVSFNENSNSLVYTKIQLIQEYKNFAFLQTPINNFSDSTS
jgi:NADH-quinone oxidoreductase subunit C